MATSEFGLNPRTIRYYERIGLLAASTRTAAGYRIYGPADRDRARFILKAKTVGLSLNEIRDILALRREGVNPCTHVLAAGEYLAHWQMPNASSDIFSPEHVAVSPDVSTVYGTDLAGDRILALRAAQPR